MSFAPEQLLAELAALPAVRRFYVAFSGGLDSLVLLHLLAGARARLPAPLEALHVNHNLHADAAAWSARCLETCSALQVPCRALQVDARAARGESPEAAAREARYTALAAALTTGDCLLSAHHADDQAETLLLQLLRGAGPRGLAAMPRLATLGRARLVRPFLTATRAELQAYAQQHGLEWIDDPSNAATDFDRNFLRHTVLPALRERWPALAETLSRGARLQAESAVLQDALAGIDWATVADSQGRLLSERLRELQSERQRNLLRYWLQRHALPLPAARVLERMRIDLLAVRDDAMPCVRWPGGEVRRYRRLLYALRPVEAYAADTELQWCLPAALRLPDGGILRAEPVAGSGLDAEVAAAVTVRFRRGGERCRPHGRKHHHALKKLLQEHGVPPWERARLPLLYVQNELAAIAGLWVCEPFAAAPGRPGYRIVLDAPAAARTAG